MAEMIQRKVYLTFPESQVKRALICEMYDAYKVKFNIRSASVSDDIGIIALELEGDAESIQKATAFFHEQGVRVEPIEMNVVAG